MTMSVHSNSENLVSQFFGWLSKSWQTAGEAQALSSMDREMLRDIARDCGVEPDQLVELVRGGPHSADEMTSMMKQLNIDPVEVATRYQLEFRDMQVNCSRCGSKAQCRSDLEAGTAAEHYAGYCRNADHLAAMRAMPELLPD